MATGTRLDIDGRVRTRTSIRMRLILVWGALFLSGGALLVAVNYLLLADRITPDPAGLRQRIERELGDPGAPAGRVPEPLGGNSSFARIAAELRREILDQLLIQSAIALAVATTVVVAAGWVVANRMLRPLKTITATARRLSERDLHQRIALRGPPDELKHLADTFDGMLERLDRAFDSQRRFVSNASHELRTPLSVIRTELEVTLDEPGATEAELRAMGETIRQATERSERLIDALLALALADGRVQLRPPEIVDLPLLLRQAEELFGAEAKKRNLRVELALGPASVVGDRALLERLCENLVQNAIRHNVDGGRVELTTAIRNGAAHVRVANGGSVVPPDQVDRLFEPYQRLGRERTGDRRGFGLGLSIVRAVTDAHSGQVSATAPRSGGLVVEVALPSATAPAGQDRAG